MYIIYIVYFFSQDLGWLIIKLYSVFCIQVRDLGGDVIFFRNFLAEKFGGFRFFLYLCTCIREVVRRRQTGAVKTSNCSRRNS